MKAIEREVELREIAELRLDHSAAETGARFSGKPPDHSAVDIQLQVDLKTLIGMESRLLEHSLESPLLPCICLLYTSTSPRDRTRCRMPSCA